MKTPILFVVSLICILNCTLTFANQEIILNDSDVSLPTLDAGEEIALIRTSRTPEKVNLSMAANAIQQVCARYETRYVPVRSPSCGYDYTYVDRCHVETKCHPHPHNPHKKICKEVNVCHVERISHMRTCMMSETYCASHRPVSTVVTDTVKLKFKNDDLRDGESELYILRMNVKNNYSSLPLLRAELDSLDGDRVKRRSLSGNFVVKD